MPVKSPDDIIFDTSTDHNVKVVNHGSETSYSDYKPLADGAKISFAENTLIGFTRINEHNLINCRQLNLADSSLTSLCTKFLSNLRVLNLWMTKICSLQTCNLRNIEFLHIGNTLIQELDTTSF